ncbi:G protein-coupled glucose receptor regulating Gpa2-domain-containing protein [Nemania sp. NC0429]|nr:G protein-coupled glucose receptor regulating Gpa2-domain-containing protein [Nemania sp. NC0429]
MAPIRQSTAAVASGLPSSGFESFIAPRDMTPTIDVRNGGQDDADMLAVMGVSLSFSTVSVVAAMLAFYWFVRMRRGFRQDLIMLLIQSDMAKSLWLIISPLFYFITKKPFRSNWVFCQVSGFLLTATIEATDMAVLLIAIHTALFIVNRQDPGAAPGLQPYRRIAYALWAIVPILIAAIVPISGSSFADNGAHCFLPMQPGWYHTALDWIPRYIIFTFIIVTYTGLYFYVCFRFRRLGEDQRRASNQSSQSAGSSTRRRSKGKSRARSASPTPALATHNLLDSPQADTSKNNSSTSRQHSATSTVSTLQMDQGAGLPTVPEPVARKRSITWNLVDFECDGAVASAPSTLYVDAELTSPPTEWLTLPSASIQDGNDDTTRPSATIISPLERIRTASSGQTSSRSRNSIRGNMGEPRRPSIRSQDKDRHSRRSFADMVSALWQSLPAPDHPTERDTDEEPGHSSSSIRLASDVSEETIRRSRDRVQRQMRLLFVYPAIYLLTWIAPFAAHLHHNYYSTITHRPGHDNSTAPAMHGATAGYGYLSAGSPHPTLTKQYYQDALFENSHISLPLRIISMASLCVGAAIDCAFFSAWERPWLYLRGGFWECLVLRLRIRRLCGAGASGDGPGRTREERFADSRAARIRRDREREMVRSWKTTAAAAAASGSEDGITMTRRTESGSRSGGGSQQTRRREWWDALDVMDEGEAEL